MQYVFLIAIFLFHSTLSVAESHLPENAAAWNQRGNLALSHGDYRDAEDAYRHALELASDPQSEARIWNNLAVTWKRQHRWDESASAYERCLQLRAEESRSAPVDYAMTLNNLAEALSHARKTGRAAYILRQALNLIQDLPQPPQSELAAVLNNFGVIKGYQGYYTSGARILERSLTVKRAIYGPSHPETQLTESNLASLKRDAANHKGPSALRVDAMEFETKRR